MNIIGYFTDRKHFGEDEINALNVIIAIREIRNNKILIYCPVGQHQEVSKKYLNQRCEQISKEKYLEASSLYYTPKEYLNG